MIPLVIPEKRKPCSKALFPVDHLEGPMGRIAGPGRRADEIAVYTYRRGVGFVIEYWRIADVRPDPVRLRLMEAA